MKILKEDVGKRTTSVAPGVVVDQGVKPDTDGLIRGRAEDGTPIRGRVQGISKARQLMLEQMEQEQKKKGRRKRRGN